MVCFKTMWAVPPGCPASRHRVGPRDVPFEAKRFRHVAGGRLAQLVGANRGQNVPSVAAVA